jgi:hypothetical protein
MFGDDAGGRAATSLRGWLSEVYFSALLDGALDSLAARLGARAVVDDPLFGRATGAPAITRQLEQTAEWLKTHGARLTRGMVVSGVDRDFAEGTLNLMLGDRALELPVVALAERRRGREVELRAYYAVELVTGKRADRPGIVTATGDATVPELVSRVLDALASNDLDTAIACFEKEGTFREATGRAHAQSGGELRRHLERYAQGGFVVDVGGTADDGRACAVELSLVKIGGRDAGRQPGLFVFERGENGGLHAVRAYDDYDVA